MPTPAKDPVATSGNATSAGRSTGVRTDQTTRYQAVFLVIPVIYLLALYIQPLFSMLLRSVLDPQPGFQNYIYLIKNPVYLRVLWLTVKISLEVCAVSLAIGYPIAYVISNSSPRLSRLLSLLVILPLWTSVLVRSFSWMVILGDNGVVPSWFQAITGREAPKMLYSEFSVVIGIVHVLLPFMILSVRSTLDQIDTTLISAAETLGAKPARAFLAIYLPLSAPGVISGTMLVFIMSLGFYLTPALLGGPGQTMISNLIEQLVDSTFQWGVAASLAAILLALSTLLYLLVRRAVRLEGFFGR